MDSKQLALRPISTRNRRGGSVGGQVAAAMERSSLATASFRVYYSLRPGAVPFLWESTPGTPKSGGFVAGATASVSPAEMAAGIGAELPPILPPPSYHSSQLKKGKRPSCPGGCVLRALLAALGVSRRSRRHPASQL
ncbi:hypothetical protein BAE44_0006919 [Dichanthelium oligosanthes]|uniref:Uncharacterized protein n=1 Tax=Dichanthelium oligosanthes TaxID=888268 RepID=A0A1E5W3V4_9POAL|nr:hypothetical protein BAE44_0006919 [Dichanthelium oligosanthes]